MTEEIDCEVCDGGQCDFSAWWMEGKESISQTLSPEGIETAEKVHEP